MDGTPCLFPSYTVSFGQDTILIANGSVSFVVGTGFLSISHFIYFLCIFVCHLTKSLNCSVTFSFSSYFLGLLDEVEYW